MHHCNIPDTVVFTTILISHKGRIFGSIATIIRLRSLLYSPALRTQWNGTHTFSWPTKHACPQALPPDAPGPQPPDADVEARQPVTRSVSLSMFFMLFWAMAFMFALQFFYPSLSCCSRRLPPRFPRAGPRSKSFRPSVSNLVQWAAAEDLLEEYDIDSADGFFRWRTNTNAEFEGNIHGRKIWGRLIELHTSLSAGSNAKVDRELWGDALSTTVALSKYSLFHSLDLECNVLRVETAICQVPHHVP